MLLDGPAPPRIRVAPSARANSWEDVADLAASLNFALDEWQEQVLEAAMGERADGRWASKFVGVSAPRQNGKSQLIVARALAGILLFGEKMIIISAHETDTARQIWKRLLDVIEDNPTLEARVTGRMDAINREYLSFGKGADRQEIRLKARRKSGSRGFSADCLLLDEAQILGKGAWGSIVPTMSARKNPQLWLFGTPPTQEDEPFAFDRVRSSSLAKKARHCWLEWAADPADDFNAVETWAKSNPSFGVRVSEEACADDRAAMDDEQFALERLGIWAAVGADAIYSPAQWRGLVDESSQPTDELAFGVYVNLPRTNAAIFVASKRHDGLVHVESMPASSGAELLPGTGWIPARVKELVDRWSPRAVVIDNHSGAASLIADIEALGVAVTKTNTSDRARADNALFDAINEQRIRHLEDPDTAKAVTSAKWRELGDSRAYDRKDKTSDITRLVAMSLALHGLSAAPSPALSAYNDDSYDFMML